MKTMAFNQRRGTSWWLPSHADGLVVWAGEDIQQPTSTSAQTGEISNGEFVAQQEKISCSSLKW